MAVLAATARDGWLPPLAGLVVARTFALREVRTRAVRPRPGWRCAAAITRIRKHAESMNAAPRVGQAQSQLSSLPWHEYWNTD
jgi:hypothetical protein